MNNKKVMVIDDEIDIREGVSAVLDIEGYKVIEAINGQDALNKLTSLAPEDLPDVIILDLMMPIMDGQTFLNEVSQYPSLKKIPVVIVSANLKNASEIAQSFSVAKLNKPMEIDDLYTVVDQLCGTTR